MTNELNECYDFGSDVFSMSCGTNIFQPLISYLDCRISRSASLFLSSIVPSKSFCFGCSVPPITIFLVRFFSGRGWTPQKLVDFRLLRYFDNAMKMLRQIHLKISFYSNSNSSR